jgi:hypothetical protein
MLAPARPTVPPAIPSVGIRFVIVMPCRTSGFALIGIAPVPHLFRSRSPADVPRLVVAVIVNAIYRVGRRGFRPGVVEECFERACPFIADGDSATAIVWPALVVGIRAAVSHAEPRVVFRRASAAVGRLRARVITCDLLSQATARAGSAASQPVASGQDFVAAHAVAQPAGVFADIATTREHGQTSESLSDEVERRYHVIRLRHSFRLDQDGVAA